MKKILVVDDDEDVLSVVKFVLTHHKFNVKATWKWRTITRTIRSFIPDLILLDVDLEGADGGEICRKLKQFRATQHVPVILISVHPMPEKYLKANSAQGFLAKPFEPSHLLEVINDKLN